LTGGASGTGGKNGSGGAIGTGGGSGSRDAGTTGSAVSYSKQIAPIIKTNCSGCHGGSSPQAGVNLSTYAGLKSSALAANDVIQGGAMPPSGQLSAANMQLFQSWVDAGMPNN
jgi:mono/diheme cytochrome c family protein